MLKFVIHIFNDFNRLGLQRTAAQLAFSSLFALVPLFALSLQVLLLLPVLSQYTDQVVTLIIERIIPEGLATWRFKIVEWLSGLRQISVLGIVIFAVSTLFFMSGLVNAINQIWEVPFSAVRVFRVWLSLLMVPLGLAVIVFLETFSQSVQWLNQLSGIQVSHNLKFWAGPLIGILSLWLIYSRIPAVKVDNRKSLVVAVITMLAMSALSQSLMQLVRLMPSLELMTGILSTLPLIMLWIYWLAIFLLLGALVLRHWQIGQLTPLNVLSFDQLIDLLCFLRRHREMSLNDAIALDINPKNWETISEFLVSNRLATNSEQQNMVLQTEGLQQPFSVCLPLICHRYLKESDPGYLVLQPLSQTSIEQLLGSLDVN
ncbi:YihY/virulence factor BrkB family protein [Gynuella sunshinyii]|uniref:Putative membrane protein n=1 Tax=Gynuella sunshinyii YC6258 TaxID=1445510 RepID=A0A0C5VLM4_9GAMM|nr:YihY/virulence factor BrkB family protein [Gynuella sunshinyii]AJQ95191.1 putative membrane protein [Gynuella sunshinyii YC6258]